MPHYIVLGKWTDQGITNVRETIQRAEATRAQVQEHGFSLGQVYWTFGHYDIVAIGEAPDDESAAAFSLEVGSAGNLRTTTMRGYDRDEMLEIIEKLG